MMIGTIVQAPWEHLDHRARHGQVRDAALIHDAAEPAELVEHADGEQYEERLLEHEAHVEARERRDLRGARRRLTALRARRRNGRARRPPGLRLSRRSSPSRRTGSERMRRRRG